MIKVITQPELEPVSLDEVYASLRLDVGEGNDAYDTLNYDGMLSRYITTARVQCEQITRRAFVEQTLKITSNRFPFCRVRFNGDYDYETRNGFIELLRPELIEVVSVGYYDKDNVLQTVSPSNYYIDNSHIVPRLQFIDNYAFPSIYPREDSLEVVYKAGYAREGADLLANVPKGIKDAIIIGVQLLYDPLSPEQREAYKTAQENLLYSYKIHSF